MSLGDTRAHAATRRLGDLVDRSGNPNDRYYYSIHKDRFAYAASRILSLRAPKARVIDIGSHYLHFASLLSLLGYEVFAMDVSAFCRLDFVGQRSRELGIRMIENDFFERGGFMPEEAGSFDIVSFNEIFEHITFNPIRFWRSVYGLLKEGGLIYLTTPNSLRIINLLHALKQALLLRGIGIDVASIMSEVTYGHHWKEYSAAEIRRYFASLSPDFEITTRRYGYRAVPPKASLKETLKKWGNKTDLFCEEIEAVIRVPAKTKWLLEAPSFA